MTLIVRTLVLIALVTAPVLAQPKPAAKKPAAAKSAPSKAAEPATAEAAAKVLDLRTLGTPAGAKIGGNRTLGMLTYEVQAAPKAAFDFQRQQLKKLGFAEAPGGYADDVSGKFTKEGYEVAVSASPSYEPEKKGWTSVTLFNHGNVAVEKLPVPPGTKPFHPEVMPGSYLTDAKPAETAAACRKLLIAAGWEPYDEPAAGDKQDFMQNFKRNAIQLRLRVSTAPAQGNKTTIDYSTELLQTDLPVFPGLARADYTDFQKTLRFDAPLDQEDAILKFYQEKLPKLAWTATTERPVSDDVKKTKFLIFRNPAKDLLSLDLQQFKDIVRVKLSHQTAAEVAEEDKRAKEFAEKEKAKLAEKNKPIKLVLPLPVGAEGLEKTDGNLVEFKLKTGGGPTALKALRDHFVKAGWKEDDGTLLDENAGNIDLQKDDVRLSLSYLDTGILPAEVRVSGPKNVVFDPQASKEKPRAETGKPTTKPKPTIPGLPELPPGVELPDDVKSQIEKALKDAEGLKPSVPKKPIPKPKG